MADTETIDELGPVDYLVVEFPAGKENFTGEMTSQLTSLIESGTIRVLDLLIMHKDASGEVDAFEVDDLENADELRVLETHAAAVLAADDVPNLAAAMEKDSTAGVVIWENLWAAPFAAAVRHAGGQLIAQGRIPVQAIAASIEAEQAEEEAGLSGKGN